MTREETKLILNRIFKLYITQSRRFRDSEKRDMLNTWAEEFANESYEDVNKAVSLYSKSGKPFMPNVPDIQQALIDMEDTEGNRLFSRLARAAEMAKADGVKDYTSKYSTNPSMNELSDTKKPLRSSIRSMPPWTM